MESVFNVSPPAFTKSEIAEIARKHYTIKGDVDELFSDRDQNFIVKDSGHTIQFDQDIDLFIQIWDFFRSREN